MTNLNTAQKVTIHGVGMVALTEDKKMYVVKNVEVSQRTTYHPVTLDQRTDDVYELQIVREVTLEDLRQLVANKAVGIFNGHTAYVKTWAYANELLTDIEIFRIEGNHELADRLEESRKPKVEADYEASDVIGFYF